MANGPPFRAIPTPAAGRRTVPPTQGPPRAGWYPLLFVGLAALLMLLRCEPALLEFSADSRAGSSQTLRLSSSAGARAGGCVAYKVRTTAPQQFAVAPVIGLIKPGECVDVRGECATNERASCPACALSADVFANVRMCGQ